VTGPAGCGKTEMAVSKILSEIEDKHLKTEQRVLCLSFSRAARTRMMQALRHRSCRKNMPPVDVLTFDAFCLILCRKYGDLLGFKYPIRVKPTNGLPDLVETCNAYYADFKELTHFGCRVLSFPHVADTYADCYPIVVVDEFQDTRRRHYELLQKLAGVDVNIWAFGDEFQAINVFDKDDFDPLVQSQQDGTHMIRIKPIPNGDRFENPLIRELAESIRNNVIKSLPVTKGWTVPYLKEEAYFAKILRTKIADLVSNHKSIAVLCKRNEDVFFVSDSLLKDNVNWGPRRYHKVDVADEFRADHWDLFAAIWQTMLSTSKNACENAKDILAKRKFTRSPIKEFLCGPFRSQKCICCRRAHELTGKATSDLEIVFQTCETLLDIVARKGPKARKLDQSINAMFQVVPPGTVIKTPNSLNLLFSRLESRIRTFNDFRAPNEPRGVRVMTIHQAKNRQFDAVILVYNNRHGWHNGENQEHLAKDRMLLYEAVSRPKRTLIILYYKDAKNPPLGPILSHYFKKISEGHL